MSMLLGQERAENAQYCSDRAPEKESLDVNPRKEFTYCDGLLKVT